MDIPRPAESRLGKAGEIQTWKVGGAINGSMPVLMLQGLGARSMDLRS